jgi:hypothetical protein
MNGMLTDWYDFGLILGGGAAAKKAASRRRRKQKPLGFFFLNKLIELNNIYHQSLSDFHTFTCIEISTKIGII